MNFKANVKYIIPTNKVNNQEIKINYSGEILKPISKFQGSNPLVLKAKTPARMFLKEEENVEDDIVDALNKIINIDKKLIAKHDQTQPLLHSSSKRSLQKITTNLFFEQKFAKSSFEELELLKRAELSANLKIKSKGLINYSETSESLSEKVDECLIAQKYILDMQKKFVKLLVKK